MNIEEFLPIKSRVLSKMGKFELAKKKCTSKEGLRALEMQYLRPEKLQKTTQVNHAASIDDRIIEVVFANEEDIQNFKQFFSVTSRRSLGVKQSLYRINLLLDFIAALKSGEISYDSETRKFKYQTEPEHDERRSDRKRDIASAKLRHLKRSKQMAS